MKEFNKWEACSGSEHSTGGGLIGSTDTDHFYFLCPKCGDTHIMQMIDFDIRHNQPLTHADTTINDQREKEFIIYLELYCVKCGLHDFVKIVNVGLQNNRLADRTMSLKKEFIGKVLKWA